jgi:hypothetical protein
VTSLWFPRASGPQPQTWYPSASRSVKNDREGRHYDKSDTSRGLREVADSGEHERSCNDERTKHEHLHTHMVPLAASLSKRREGIHRDAYGHLHVSRGVPEWGNAPG